MTPDDRYDVSGLPEAQFEPGLHGQVLKNRLGIVSKQQMDDAEAKSLQQSTDELIRKYDETHRFTAADLCESHKVWLGHIYEWAGQYRWAGSRLQTNGETFRADYREEPRGLLIRPDLF